MQNIRLIKFLYCLAAVLLFLTPTIQNTATAKDNAKSLQNNTKTNKEEQKKITRVRQYFGKQGIKGNDYSAESTAGVGGLAQEGLKATEPTNSKAIKEDLYSDEGALDNAIKQLNKSGK